MKELSKMDNAKKIVEKIRGIVGSSTCDERELYELLADEADIWRLRLAELEEDDEGP